SGLSSGSGGCSSPSAGTDGTRYSSPNHFPRSIRRQRSEQNGKDGFLPRGSIGFLHTGQGTMRSTDPIVLSPRRPRFQPGPPTTPPEPGRPATGQERAPLQHHEPHPGYHHGDHQAQVVEQDEGEGEVVGNAAAGERERSRGLEGAGAARYRNHG